MKIAAGMLNITNPYIIYNLVVKFTSPKVLSISYVGFAAYFKTPSHHVMQCAKVGFLFCPK